MSWLPKTRVLVPVDFSDESFAAVDVALNLVEQPQGLVVVHVLQELSQAEPGEMWRTIDNEARMHHAAQALRERLSEDKYKDVNIDVLLGDAGQKITDLAQRDGYELIVLPSHGRTGLTRLLLGSVAERVIRLAHCPVLVLRS